MKMSPPLAKVPQKTLFRKEATWRGLVIVLLMVVLVVIVVLLVVVMGDKIHGSVETLIQCSILLEGGKAYMYYIYVLIVFLCQP